jgi:hypothetical protein
MGEAVARTELLYVARLADSILLEFLLQFRTLLTEKLLYGMLGLGMLAWGLERSQCV